MNNKFYPLNEFVFRRPFFNYRNISLDDFYIKELCNKDFFQEAIYYASPDLYLELKKYLKDELSQKKQKKMMGTLYKYVQRMLYRCTPFGMFALCGVGNYANYTSLPDSSSIRLHYRFDYQFLYDYVMFLYKKCFHDLLPLINVCTNQTIIKIAGYYKLTVRDDNGGLIDIKVNHTEVLDFILDYAHKGIKLQDIINACLEAFEIDPLELNGYLHNLLVNGILLSNIQVETIEQDNFIRIYNKIKDSNVPLINEMHITLNTLNSNCCFDIKRRSIDSLFNKACQLGIKAIRNQIIQVDAYTDSTLYLFDNVKENLIEWFNILVTLNMPIGNPLTNFINRYNSRYEEMEMPLLQVLDKSVGLGYNNSYPYKSSLIENIYKTPGNRVSNKNNLIYSISILEQVVLDKIIKSKSFTIKKVDLEAEDVKKYNESEEFDLSYSYSCIFKVVGYNASGPVLSGVSFSGPSAACLLTRFADGHDGINRLISVIGDKEQRVNGDYILAEISHLSSPHAGNVQIRPSFREFEIPYLSYKNEMSASQLDLKDLTVCVRNGKISLHSKFLDKSIIPCFTSAFNYKFNTSELYQFLGDIQQQNSMRTIGSRLDTLLLLLKHTPRVCYKNIIVSPESWLLDNNWDEPDPSCALIKFKDIHANLQMPQYLSFNQGDNYFVIDITSNESINEFLHLSKKIQKIVLTEFLPLSDDFHHYDSVIEIVQPFIPKV